MLIFFIVINFFENQFMYNFYLIYLNFKIITVKINVKIRVIFIVDYSHYNLER